jgi:cobalt-zinc-cadmium efflux system membrane fusion protein
MKKLLFLAVPVFIVFYFTGCGNKINSDLSAPKFSISDTFRRYIAIDTIKQQQVVSKLNLTGKVTYDENEVVRIYPFTGGKIQSLDVELGDYVHKGQVLAVIRSFETADYANQFVQAESNLLVAKQNVESAKNAYSTGLISEKEYIISQSDLRKVQSELERIKNIVSLIGEGTGKNYTVKAPVSGYVVEKNANKKMEFRSDNSTNLFTIANLDKVYVIANVFESDINNIKEGYPANITTISYPGKVFSGRIDKIYNVIDPDTKVMKVRIKLNNPDILLKPEMFASIEVTYPENNTMMYVPSSAVIFDKNTHFVVVYHSPTNLENRQVQIYKSVGNVTYITGGLKEGETVISKKALFVYDALND